MTKRCSISFTAQVPRVPENVFHSCELLSSIWGRGRAGASDAAPHFQGRLREPGEMRLKIEHKQNKETDQCNHFGQPGPYWGTRRCLVCSFLPAITVMSSTSMFKKNFQEEECLAGISPLNISPVRCEPNHPSLWEVALPASLCRGIQS